MYSTDEDRWRAVVARSPEAEGQFFYSVRTTGVFCRPACGARVPKRENVAFHATAADAREAGFRPCRRCNPEGRPLEREWADAVARACRSIEESENPVSTVELAEAAAMSTSHFQRVFKAVTGMTPKSYSQSVRSARVRQVLPGAGSVTDAVYRAGYNSSSRFYEGVSRTLGMPPASYRAGGAGQTIRFGVGECSLGSILVAATERGVCAVLMGDDPGALTEELRRRFPNARVSGGDAEFEAWMAGVIALVESPGSGAELPVDVRGTAFQHLVWNALQQIPCGQTASYAEVAERVGRPAAARAVAAACASNSVAVVIPCHRVVRSDGSLSGYRWGVERKRELLRRESTRKL
jgi:AraC family transcriptional regulator of adaptative response/methylated-DNA-[protein]-cysteine methyltransferase